jgi:hypothetical protein
MITMKIPISFFTSKELKATPNDAIILYLLMRSDAQEGQTTIAKLAKKKNHLVTGFDVGKLAKRSGLAELTVIRLLDDLVKRKWIEKYEQTYKLGDIVDYHLKWGLDKLVEEESLPVESSVLTKVQEDRELLLSRRKVVRSADIRRKLTSKALKGVIRSNVSPRDLILHFLGKFRDKFGEKCPLVDDSFPKTMAYVKRTLKWSSDGEHAVQVVDFMFSNWDAVKEAMSLDGKPSFHLIGSSKVWPRIVTFYEEGIPRKKKSEDITDRYKAKPVERTVGW